MSYLTRQVETAMLEKPEITSDVAANYGRKERVVYSVLRPGRYSIHFDALRDVLAQEVGLNFDEWQEQELDVEVRVDPQCEFIEFCLKEKEDGQG